MNVFQDKIVTAIKVGGKVLRENGDTVTLPFGSEYSILVKNLNSVRTQVTISVDGTDAAGKLVIGPNSSLELERFIRNGNLETGNRFKFIERTAEVEAHRGITVDDGLIRVEAWREQVTVPRYRDEILSRPRASVDLQAFAALDASFSAPMDFAFGAAGITVPGSASQQRFIAVSGFPLEKQSTVIVLRLRGEVAGQRVEQPVTVDRKPECSTCGKTNAALSQFCSQCGTALVLI